MLALDLKETKYNQQQHSSEFHIYLSFLGLSFKKCYNMLFIIYQPFTILPSLVMGTIDTSCMNL